jgi:Raf kinase inhibitor-like YbhB/YbcL family protein
MTPIAAPRFPSLFVLFALAGCGQGTGTAAASLDMASRPSDMVTPPVLISSPAFPSGGALPIKYAHTMCNGMNVNPPLKWSGFPAATRSFTLVMDDPDATDINNIPFTHWMVWDLPATTTSVDEGASGKTIPGTEGRNDFGDLGYGGPCPVALHHYRITVYALDVPGIGLASVSSRKDVDGQIALHTLASGVLTTTFAP